MGGSALWEELHRYIEVERKRIMKFTNPAKRARELASLDMWIRGETEKYKLLETLDTRG